MQGDVGNWHYSAVARLTAGSLIIISCPVSASLTALVVAALIGSSDAFRSRLYYDTQMRDRIQVVGLSCVPGGIAGLAILVGQYRAASEAAELSGGDASIIPRTPSAQSPTTCGVAATSSAYIKAIHEFCYAPLYVEEDLVGRLLFCAVNLASRDCTCIYVFKILLLSASLITLLFCVYHAMWQCAQSPTAMEWKLRCARTTALQLCMALFLVGEIVYNSSMGRPNDAETVCRAVVYISFYVCKRLHVQRMSMERIEDMNSIIVIFWYVTSRAWLSSIVVYFEYTPPLDLRYFECDATTSSADIYALRWAHGYFSFALFPAFFHALIPHHLPMKVTVIFVRLLTIQPGLHALQEAFKCAYAKLLLLTILPLTSILLFERVLLYSTMRGEATLQSQGNEHPMHTSRESWGYMEARIWRWVMTLGASFAH